MIRLLHEAVEAQGIDVRLGTAATSLTTDETGRVVGVSVQDKQGQVLEIEAHRGVVLAAGGFGKNKEMLEKYTPKLVGQLSTSAGGSTGDGIRIGMEVGAEAVNMDSAVILYNTLSKDLKFKDLMPMSFMLAMSEGIAVNKEGLRFMDESVSYAQGTSRIMRQRDCVAFVVFDEQTKNKAELAGYDEVFTGETIEELAAELNIDRRALAETVASYNEAVSKASAGEHSAQRHPLRGRLFAMPISAAILMTHGGLKINAQAQVIHQRGYPIPGLYAAGDNAPGLGGPSDGYSACPGYLSGLGYLMALCFGRIAGRNAGKES